MFDLYIFIWKPLVIVIAKYRVSLFCEYRGIVMASHNYRVVTYVNTSWKGLMFRLRCAVHAETGLRLIRSKFFKVSSDKAQPVRKPSSLLLIVLWYGLISYQPIFPFVVSFYVILNFCFLWKINNLFLLFKSEGWIIGFFGAWDISRILNAIQGSIWKLSNHNTLITRWQILW